MGDPMDPGARTGESKGALRPRLRSLATATYVRFTSLGLWPADLRSFWSWLRFVTRWAALLIVPTSIASILWHFVAHPWTLGLHAWDAQETVRYVVQKAFVTYHQFPFWDPYTCGGHSAWEYLESDAVVMSPWLPAYLLLSLPIALRVEIIGSALWGAVGGWLFASRFTSSWALRAFVVVVGWVNGRWALQLGAGHVWQLLFSFVPWILFFFDRAIERDASLRVTAANTTYAAVCLALMVCMGGIYPVPHVAMTLGIYALVLTILRRSVRPLGVLAACGALTAGLSAPRLLPFLDLIGRYPRLTEIGDTLSIDQLIRALTEVGPHDNPVQTHVDGYPGMWHEWGCYIGWPALLILIVGFLGPHGPRERALRWVTIFIVLCTLGPFSKYSPWTLLHDLPLFKSQHVPSRWMFSAFLPAACVAAARGERLLRWSGRARAVLETALTVGVALIALQIAPVPRRTVAESFSEPVPDLNSSTAPFHTIQRMPYPDWRYAWGIRTLPNLPGNVGSIDCTIATIHSMFRDSAGHFPGLGGRGYPDPEYKGEIYVDEGHGSAAFSSWTPSRIEVHVAGAEPGDHLVLNQNWDAGWTANGVRATRYRDCVSAVLDAPNATVVFEYRPPWMGTGVGVFAVTVGALAGFFVWLRRRDKRASSPP